MDARTHRTQAGFSLLELVIVLGLIGVLVGGVITGVILWNRKAPRVATEKRVWAAANLVSAFEHEHALYPPAHVLDLGKVLRRNLPVDGGNNTTNRGIESLVQGAKLAGSRVRPRWKDADTGNLDDDRLTRAIAKDGNPDLLEILDGWGNPLVYIPNGDYDRVRDGVRVTLGRTSRHAPGTQIAARPWRDANGHYVNADTFQVFSMGEDGIPNTVDDIGNWNTN